MTLSLPSKIVLILIGVVIFASLIKIMIDQRAKKYFQSQSFIELNRETDNIPDAYEKIQKLSHRIKQSAYVNFSPSTIDEMEMQNYHGDTFKRNENLPAHTYLCTKEIMDKYANDNYALLHRYCGFSNNPAVQKYMLDMFENSKRLNDMVASFQTSYEETMLRVEDNIPTFINVFKKKTVLLMLGMQLNLEWDKNLFPTYTFRQIDDSQNEIKIELTPETLPKIIEYFQ